MGTSGLMKQRYQKSNCRNNYLHDLRQVKNTGIGYLERCTRCGIQKHFPLNVPNAEYLAWHIRSALQPTDKLFFREYPEALKS